jgi:hypothetical protein
MLAKLSNSSETILEVPLTSCERPPQIEKTRHKGGMERNGYAARRSTELPGIRLGQR